MNFKHGFSRYTYVYSHAVGRAISRPYGFEIDYVRNPISEAAVLFFVIIHKCIFTSIFEIKINERKFLDTKNFILKDRF